MEVVLILHVLLGAVWLGGALFAEGTVSFAGREGPEEYARISVAMQNAAGKIYPVVVPLIAVTAGVLIAGSDHIGWGDMWVSLAFGIWLISLVLGIVYYMKKAKEYTARLADEGATASLVADLAKTQMVQRFDLLLLLGLLVLMILKPGS